MRRFVLVLLLIGIISETAFAQGRGAFFTEEYPNMLAEWGLDEAEIQNRIDEAWQQLFYGDDDTERIYYPVGDDMAYIMDIGNQDIRSEGMSYGMMVAVQLDKKEEFDRIWTWTKTYMYNSEAPYKGYFAWHCEPDGTKIDTNPASDGEEWFVTALFFAAARWGNGEGIYNYEAEANAILNVMLHQDSDIATPMFDEEYDMVVFVPMRGKNGNFTDPSYHLPHYYELWSRWAAQDNDYWSLAAEVSRDFWTKTAHPETGLMPNYAKFTGEPQPSGDYGEFFYSDSWRNSMNVAMDYVWFEPGEWHLEQSNRLLNFFYELGIGRYNSKFKIDGEPASPQHRATGLIAMNAVAALASTNENRWEFIEEFWNTPLPVGQWRYYDGLLYLFALLQLSGNFRIYDPTAA